MTGERTTAFNPEFVHRSKYVDALAALTAAETERDAAVDRHDDLVSDLVTAERERDDARAALREIADVCNADLNCGIDCDCDDDAICLAHRILAALPETLVPQPPPESTCSECGRDLHGYHGSQCRYCDGTAE